MTAVGSAEVTRRECDELERDLAQAFRRALEPTDALSRERLAQLIEDLEFRLLASRLAAQTLPGQPKASHIRVTPVTEAAQSITLTPCERPTATRV
jgi:hypothetical protein